MQRLLFALLAVTAFALGGPAQSQESSCLDSARGNKELETCGDSLIYPLQDKVDAEFRRLSKKYPGNEDMQEMLKQNQQAWTAHLNTQCFLEAMAAAGGKTEKPLPVEANRTFMRCIHRMNLQMYSAMSRI